MTLVTWFLVFGGLSITAIVIDGVRRIFASHAALKIDIDETLWDVPFDEYGSELPNGGARIVNAKDMSDTLDPREPLFTDSELNNELNLDLTVQEVLGLRGASPEITIDETHAFALDTITEEVSVVELNDDASEASVEASDYDKFRLPTVNGTLNTREVTALTLVTGCGEHIRSEPPSSSLEFDPTRPVHEHVEFHAMVQNDLFSEPDLAKFPDLKSCLMDELIDTNESSDDILFNDTGIDDFDDDLANGGTEHLVQQSQDETLSTKFAKVTSMSFGKKLLNRKRAVLQESSETVTVEQQVQNEPVEEQFISILVTFNDGQYLYGSQLRKLVEACGLVYGEWNIFHRYEDGPKLGETQFSMANIMEPGAFDLNKMNHLRTQGVVFFLRLPTAKDSMNAFDLMLGTAQCLAANFGGEVRDEQRSVLRPQTIEHCRQQIRDYERRSMTRRVQL